MAKLFGNQTTENHEEEQDRLGGGGTIESGAYDGKITMAYAGKSQSSDAQSITLHVDVNGFEVRQTFWVTNRENLNYSTKDGKKTTLMGYSIVDSACLVSTGVPLSEQDVEDKVINLYDFDERKEVPKNMPVFVDLIGKEVTVGVIKQIINKKKKNESTGKYDDIDETREENIFDKFFHTPTKMTSTEAKAGMEEAIFYGKWVEKNTGKTKNKAKKITGGGASGNGAPPSASGTSTKPKSNMFNK